MTGTPPPSRELSSRHVARAFGLLWASDLPLDRFAPCDWSGEVEVNVRRVDGLPARPGGTPINNGEVFSDGARFRFGDATFDVFGGERVDWASPSSDTVPDAFFGTVVAILLAWRGLVPLHGSAVAIDGEAVLLAGSSGAGKSTLCEALVRRGGRLVSDDLSVMMPLDGAGIPLLLPGRPAIRLFPDDNPQAGFKRLQSAPMVELTRTVPLGTLVLLQSSPLPDGIAAATEALNRQLFRPRWMQVLPHRHRRAASLFRAARTISIVTLPAAREQPNLSVDDKVDRLLSVLSNRDGQDPEYEESLGL